MKQVASIPLKNIQATDPQVLINLKLRYNSLADKINASPLSEAEREPLLTQLTLVSSQIKTCLY